MVHPYGCYLVKACIAWRKALSKIWKLSPMTHCDVVALVA